MIVIMQAYKQNGAYNVLTAEAGFNEIKTLTALYNTYQ